MRAVDLEEAQTEVAPAAFFDTGPHDAGGGRDDGAVAVEAEADADLVAERSGPGHVDVDAAAAHVAHDAFDRAARADDLDGLLDLGAGQTARRVEFGQATHAGDQSVAFERLEEHVVGARADGIRMIRGRVGTREQHDARRAPVRMGLEAVTQLRPAQVGEVHVRDHDRRRSVVGGLEGGGCVAREIDGAAARQEDLPELPEHRQIIDEQDARRGGRHDAGFPERPGRRQLTATFARSTKVEETRHLLVRPSRLQAWISSTSTS